jgi:ribonuclease BN (tRNA processing enzyme)
VAKSGTIGEGDKMKIKILGAHHNESASSKCTSLLIDNKIAIDAGSFTYALSMEEQLEIKALLLSHQHYDHVRDAPSLAVVFFRTHTTLNIYATKAVCDVVVSRLFDGSLYPRYTELPKDNPAVKFHPLEPGIQIQIEGYNILPVSVHHPLPTVGYQVTSGEGKTFFYTGDTGPGLEAVWEKVNPEVLLADVTYNNRQEERAITAGHLTPDLLRRELLNFKRIKGYLPEVVLVHLSPENEKEIAREIEGVSKDLECHVTIGHEGMELSF